MCKNKQIEYLKNNFKFAGTIVVHTETKAMLTFNIHKTINITESSLCMGSFSTNRKDNYV